MKSHNNFLKVTFTTTRKLISFRNAFGTAGVHQQNRKLELRDYMTHQNPIV